MVLLRKFKNRKNNILAQSLDIKGLMFTVASRLFFYKNIARLWLRNFAENFANIKLIFSVDFPLI